MSTVNNALLKDCFIKSTLLEIAEIEALDYNSIVPTEGFKEKIKNILHTPPRKRTSTRRIAVILVAAVLVSLSVMFTVSAKMRNAVVNFVRDFFVEEHEDHSVFYVNTSTGSNATVSYPEKIETIYIPTYVEQNGYTEIYYDLAIYSVATSWEKDGFFIDLMQSVVNEDGFTVDTENANYEIKMLDGMELHTTTKYGIYTVLWVEHGYIFSMSCDEALGWNEVEKIILSIAPKS